VVTEIRDVYCMRMHGYNFFNYDCVISVPLRSPRTKAAFLLANGSEVTCTENVRTIKYIRVTMAIWQEQCNDRQINWARTETTYIRVGVTHV